MLDDSFRAYLHGRSFESKSIDSYLSSCRSVERELEVGLDASDLTQHGLMRMRATLEQRSRPGLSLKTIRNHLSALKAYAAFIATT